MAIVEVGDDTVVIRCDGCERVYHANPSTGENSRWDDALGTFVSVCPGCGRTHR